MFIDTHTHIYLEKFDEDIDQVIQNALDKGVTDFYLPNIDIKSIDQIKNLVSKFPDLCYPMMGLHPCSVGADYKDVLADIKKELHNNEYVAVGEIGVDLYWDKTFQKEQEIAFREQIEWARDLKIPFVIHSRDSLDITISIVEEMQNGSLTGIFHCFNGTSEQVKRIESVGFLMGLGGVITYKKADLGDMVRSMNIDNMVLETDAPYLSPVPYRGKRNEPAYIPDIAAKITEFRNEDIDYIAERTTKNALKLFGREE